MPFSGGEVYRNQAALVVRALPEVAREESLALKGGTGINLFIRDMSLGYEEWRDYCCFTQDTE
jgi:hypothetical protein